VSVTLVRVLSVPQLPGVEQDPSMRFQRVTRTLARWSSRPQSRRRWSVQSRLRSNRRIDRCGIAGEGRP